MDTPSEILSELEQWTRRDPARRGLIGSESVFPPLCCGCLAAAAAELAEKGTDVAIVTGFFVPTAEIPAAETDGPLGAVLLADTLERLGITTRLLTDAPCAAVLRLAARLAEYPDDRVLIYPDPSAAWRHDFFCHGFGSRLSHLIAIERVGPSHTEASLLEQYRSDHGHTSSWQDVPDAAHEDTSNMEAAILEQFCRLVPPESRNRCHNMRGLPIDDHTADMHCLFEELPRYRPDAVTIAIGDGGNEIGMGSILWQDLVRRLPEPSAARIVCRIATDWTIVSGTSNWGAYALAAATAVLIGQPQVLGPWTARRQHTLLQQLVQDGPCVDGATGRREASVDGLPFTTYIQAWEGMRRLMGLFP